MMARHSLLALLMLATLADRAHAQAEPGAAAAAEEMPPSAAPSPTVPDSPALTPEEHRALIEGRQQLLVDQRATSERQQQRNLVQGREEILHDRNYTAPQPEQRATDEEARPQFSLALSLDSLFRDDPGYDLFDDNDVSTRFGIWLGYDLVQLAPRTVLAIELFGGGENQEQAIWGGELQNELDSLTFSAGASLRYALLSWLDPQLRAAAGFSWFAVELDTNETRFEDHAFSGFASLGAGVVLHTPARLFETKSGGFASFEIGFLIEGGYTLQAPVEFALEGDSSASAIALTDASLGELSLAGPYVRSSLLVRF